jgi:DNA polymerase-3 subunit epsilon
MTWHLGMLCALDFESTGVDVETARIVTACVAWIDGSGKKEPVIRQWLIDPGIPIPEEAAKIHGITTEHAQKHGRAHFDALPEIVAELRSAMPSVPIVGHNVGSYDLNLLDRECRRHGIEPLPEASPVIDTLVLDKHLVKYRKGTGARRLTTLCETYGVRLDGAHDATYDALASARIAWKMGARNPRLAALSLPELHELQKRAAKHQDQDYAIYLRGLGNKARTADEQIELWTRADQIDAAAGYWPVSPYTKAAAAETATADTTTTPF